MLSEQLLQEMMPELGAAMARRIEEALDVAGRDVLAAALEQYFATHGRELLAPVVEMERIKRKTLLTPAEVEEVYGIKRRTLEDWRFRKIGPEY